MLKENTYLANAVTLLASMSACCLTDQQRKLVLQSAFVSFNERYWRVQYDTGHSCN